MQTIVRQNADFQNEAEWPLLNYPLLWERDAPASAHQSGPLIALKPVEPPHFAGAKRSNKSANIAWPTGMNVLLMSTWPR
ncbi:hypothetical protein I6F21_06605 [Bradyrhizobium sp. NBAIM03]|uniref:hypothetical protein n=1 Tax=Bradyrhizobium sp. NBAIM03 TaxID=2793816 RepID=UPI001CD60A22|nr:hypothetical protein [Bradyrhizobium sp. NBAIM03]MCA1532231.1 hypothetical protein [Bradyrhizobium sp. NBAIM03]